MSPRNGVEPDFANSLTVSNAASAHDTLEVLTVVALIVTPVVLLYQGWTYYFFRARITGGNVDVSMAELSPPADAIPGPTGRAPAA